MTIILSLKNQQMGLKDNLNVLEKTKKSKKGRKLQKLIKMPTKTLKLYLTK